MINATLVTVHGFWSSPMTWERLGAIWAADEQLRGLQIHDFSYLSPKKPSAPFSSARIPDYDDIAQTLATEYTVALAGADNVAIVTHSQGGLIAQRFLAWMLGEGRGRELARIRSIVMLACPNGGSEYLRSIRQILGYGRHPQAGDLEVLNRRVADTQRTVLRQIVNASGVDNYQCRIPLHVYAGNSDKVVTAASAQAGFPGASTIAGDHFSILDPACPGNRTAETVTYHLLTHFPVNPVQPILQVSPVSVPTIGHVPSDGQDAGSLAIDPVLAAHSEIFPQAEGDVTLMVRRDETGNAYHFQFIDGDSPSGVVTSTLVDLAQRSKSLDAEIKNIARGSTLFTGPEARSYLRNLGAQLWVDVIPDKVRRQFWELQDRIRQLTVLSDDPAIPWELLYPIDAEHDAGFLVEQFPLARRVFDSRPANGLRLQSRYFVLPPEAPSKAQEEIGALCQMFDAAQPSGIIPTLSSLLELIRQGNVGLLHFACHNHYDRTNDKLWMRIEGKQFVPNHLSTAAITQSLASSAPLVFVNGSSSIGWSRPFLKAGAGAFIGSLWDVRTDSAREFATEFYRQFLSGEPLGTAVFRARQAISADEGDPTWLSYAVYGDLNAKLTDQG
jgi:pimeloyl-ACP methyl ester carboxylesterase